MMYRSLTALGAAVLLSTAAQAIDVDGSYDAGYGAATATVGYNPAAPDSNFGTPTSESRYVAYSIYLTAGAGNVYGYLRADPTQGGASVGPFANVYFDIDPANGNGSDIGFELGANSQTLFIPGRPGLQAATGVITAVSADQLGFEFSIPNSYFTTVFPGANYYPGQEFAVVGGPVTLRLSQSFGFSVAGGATYGVNRLGTVTLAAVPEPATWGLMIGGFGLVGATLRRRRSIAA
ncbi:PEPxxWA-CTERM sorting domain-containing protein [Glacieibacterium frigidum]|uniref:PEPxxWA-CTERM sorting domain-containing protein n=1 Tax=Glacieibacterium frigidum TaxID=2593303 RepID=UPI001F2FBE07|nr:PEPxxWA-CTERM sorting domain-containing protein [Glacieibacterium frigidum]